MAEEVVYAAKGRIGARRETIDLTAYPDLVVIYVGMRVQSLKGLRTLLRFGRRLKASLDPAPDGLLHHERLYYGLLPPHVGMRQYWRDFASLEKWARTPPHSHWWREYLQDTGGTGFWHETYFMDGGLEAIYDGLTEPTGLQTFAPPAEPKGGLLYARRRARREGRSPYPAPVTEEELEEGEFRGTS